MGWVRHGAKDGQWADRSGPPAGAGDEVVRDSLGPGERSAPPGSGQRCRRGRIGMPDRIAAGNRPERADQGRPVRSSSSPSATERRGAPLPGTAAARAGKEPGVKVGAGETEQVGRVRSPTVTGVVSPPPGRRAGSAPLRPHLLVEAERIRAEQRAGRWSPATRGQRRLYGRGVGLGVRDEARLASTSPSAHGAHMNQEELGLDRSQCGPVGHAVEVDLPHPRAERSWSMSWAEVVVFNVGTGPGTLPDTGAPDRRTSG